MTKTADTPAQRPLRFRAWDKRQQKMLYKGFVIAPTTPDWSAHMLDESLRERIRVVYEEHYKGDPLASFVEPSLIDWSDWYGIEELIIMQWTGLVDREGTPIYDQDVIKDYEAHYKIYWDDTIAAWDLLRLEDNSNMRSYGCYDFEIVYQIAKESKLVGSIYSDPKLLEK